MSRPIGNPQSVNVFTNTAKDITLSGVDPNDPPQPLTFTVTSQPLHGTLDGLAPDLTYTPEIDYTGRDSFTFRVSNGAETSSPDTTIILTVGFEFGPGGWTQTVAAKCCDCPLATVEVGYSERVDVGFGFNEWTDYSFGVRLSAHNSDPASGGFDLQVRVKIRVHGSGVACIVRFSQLNSIEDETSRNVYTRGDLHTIEVPADDSVFDTDYTFVPCSIGESAVLIGAPGRAVVELTGKTQSAALKMKGFLSYISGLGPPTDTSPVIYKKEEVLSGGDPGCPNVAHPENSRPPRDYSGFQEFLATVGDTATNWIDDPAGFYRSTLSPDLVEDNYVSKPFGSLTDADEFGKSEYRDTEKDTIEKYICGTNPQEKILNLALSDIYLPSDLKSAVDTALETQAAKGYLVFVGVGEQAVMHRYFISPGQTFYDRVHTSEIRAGVTSAPAVLANDGGSVSISVTCLAILRHLDGGPSVESTMNFEALVYAQGILVGPDGRPSLTPAEAGFPDVDPTNDPWGSLRDQSAEVIIKKVTAKPHNLVVTTILFAEPESVIAEGIDGV